MKYDLKFKCVKVLYGGCVMWNMLFGYISCINDLFWFKVNVVFVN